MGKKTKPAAPDRDVLVEIASMLTLAHIQVARAQALAKSKGLQGIAAEAGRISTDLRREATVALGSATKGDG